jgi:hypothetical protein
MQDSNFNGDQKRLGRQELQTYRCHCGPDPQSSAPEAAWMPDQVRHDNRWRLTGTFVFFVSLNEIGKNPTATALTFIL